VIIKKATHFDEFGGFMLTLAHSMAIIYLNSAYKKVALKLTNLQNF